MANYTLNMYTIVTVKGTQVHLTTTNTTTHKERTYTMSIDNLLDLIIQYKEAAQLIETAQAVGLHQHPPGQQSHQGRGPGSVYPVF